MDDIQGDRSRYTLRKLNKRTEIEENISEKFISVWMVHVRICNNVEFHLFRPIVLSNQSRNIEALWKKRKT